MSIIQRIMGIIKIILESLRPDSGDDGEKTNGNKGKSKVTNKILYKELIEHFVTDMEELSVGRTILYPMSFNILLHPDDYSHVGESLPFILPEVIAGFYAAIKTKRDSIHNSHATPPATYWFFQFASSSVKKEEKKESYIIPGEIVTFGSLTTFDINNIQKGTRVDNVSLSMKCQNSDVIQNNINPDALLGMEILTNNAFRFNFDKNMSEKLSDIKSSERGGNNALATLTYSDGPVNVHLKMLDELVILSGSKETRNMENIMIINSEAVDVGHVQIRYVKEMNKFQLCAYSKTRLNMREVPISVGGTPIWKDMAYNSDIFLNDEVNVKFRASEAIISRMQ